MIYDPVTEKNKFPIGNFPMELLELKKGLKTITTSNELMSIGHLFPNRLIHRLGFQSIRIFTLLLFIVFLSFHMEMQNLSLGFSINKHLLSVHGNSTKEDTLVALRFVEDGLIRVGGLKYFVVTKDLIKCCREARNKYEENLRIEREKKASDAKKERDQAAAAAAAKQVGNQKLNEQISQHRIDIQTLQTEIKATEALAKEGNKELSAQLMKNVLDGSKLKDSQTKIDMALKRKDQLAAEVKSIEKGIRIAEKKLKK